MLSLVMSTLVACAAISQLSLGVVAAVNDKGDTDDGRIVAWDRQHIDRFDIFYSKQWDKHLCAGSDKQFKWASWGAVDVLLILVASVELVVCVITASLACRSMCCGRVMLKSETLIDNGAPHPQTYYLNSAYNGDTGGPPPNYVR
jgi:hypothetical protein